MALITVSVGKVGTTSNLSTHLATNGTGRTVMAVEVKPAGGATGVPTGFVTFEIVGEGGPQT